MDVREASASYAGFSELPRDPVPLGYKQTEVGVIPEDWEVRKLRQISPSQSVGLVINPSTYYANDGTIPMLVGSNVEANRIDWESARRISDVSNRLISASQLAAGDLVTVRVGEPGITAVVPRELDGCNCASMMIVRKGPAFDSNWLCYVMNSSFGLSQIEHVQYGTAQKQFNVGDAVNFVYPFPALTEQEVIAEALSDADALIESLEQLIAKKRQIKQGTMQALLTGRQRLPEFRNEWQMKRVGELLSIMHGKSQHAVEDERGRYPILATGGQIGVANCFLYDKPSVLIGRKGTINRPQYMDMPFWSVDTLFYSVIREPNVAKYLFYRFCLIDWMQYNEASGVPSLNARTIEQVELKTPEADEQTAIAAILTDMDAELTELETRLAKTQQLKQGMMQELLTGRIRLI
jgi:type I restriction enzyme, S subunit